MSNVFNMGLTGSKGIVIVNETDSANVSESNLIPKEESIDINNVKNRMNEELHTLDIDIVPAVTQCLSTNDSTLESEIDALNKIIIDVKEEALKSISDSSVGEQCNNKIGIKVNFNDACISQTDKISKKREIVFECDAEKEETASEFQEQEYAAQCGKKTLIDVQNEYLKDINIQSSTHSFQDFITETFEHGKNDLSNTSISISNEPECKTDSNISTVSNLNNSLLMIGEAYVSEDSQESEDEKVVHKIVDNMNMTKVVTTDDFKEMHECKEKEDLATLKDSADSESSLGEDYANQITGTQKCILNSVRTNVQSDEFSESLSNNSVKLNFCATQEDEVHLPISSEGDADRFLEEGKNLNDVPKLYSENENFTPTSISDNDSQSNIIETLDMKTTLENKPIQSPSTIEKIVCMETDRNYPSCNLENLVSTVSNMETIDSGNLNVDQCIYKNSDSTLITDIIPNVSDHEELNNLENQKLSDVQTKELNKSIENINILSEKLKDSNYEDNTKSLTTLSSKNVVSNDRIEVDPNVLTVSKLLCDVSEFEKISNSEKTSTEDEKEKNDAPPEVSSKCKESIQPNEKIFVEQVEELSTLNLSKFHEKFKDNEDVTIESTAIDNQLINQLSEKVTNISDDIRNDLKREENSVLLENKSEDFNNSCDPDSSFTNPEASELESAVKFLQESEENIVDSNLELPQKMKETIANVSEQAEDFFISRKITDENSLVACIDSITQNSISISEAEIISEAAKLESERIAKLSEESFKIEANLSKSVLTNLFNADNCSEGNEEPREYTVSSSSEVPSPFKASVLEDRLKEPPIIEIPNPEMLKTFDSFSTSKSSLLIQKGVKHNMHSKIECSIKSSEKTDISKKDLEKSDSENVGSPRIILKIAKSAIADCGEQKSPKSPKLRSAANSPNPDDSPGQKLGKIKLKLSKSGHLSIISNENVEETSHRYAESSTTLSPIGMKIKLSKTGEASVVQSEKVEGEQIENKSEEDKKSDCSIAMRIKLTKSGDASIISQDLKECLGKNKEKSEFTQDALKRNESPIGMKLKLSKTGDVSIVPSEKQLISDEIREAFLKNKEKQESSQEAAKRTESPLGMKIKLLKSGDASIVSSDYSEEVKATSGVSDKKDTMAEINKFRSESPVGMKIKLSKTKCGSSSVTVGNAEECSEKLEIIDNSKRTESTLGMKIKLSKSGDASIIQQEDSVDIAELVKDKEVPENFSNTSAKHTDSIGMTIKVSKTGEATILHCKSIELPNVQSEKHDSLEEFRGVNSHLETFKKMESSSGIKIKLIKTGDASVMQREIPSEIELSNVDSCKSEKEQNLEIKSQVIKTKHGKLKDLMSVDLERKEKQKTIKESTKRTDEPSLEMKIKLSKTGHPTIVTCETNSDASSNRNKEIIDSQPNLTHKFNQAKEIEKETYSKNYSLISNVYSSTLQNEESEKSVESQSLIQKKGISKEISHKRKDISFSLSESKKLKFEAKLSEILPEVTIQPVVSKEQRRTILESNSKVSHERNYINKEVCITEVKIKGNIEPVLTSSTTEEKMLNKIITSSPASSDCEIIEHRPELVIVNENSNSSQDVVIIEEVPLTRLSEVKVPKKRGRPRRNDTSSRFIEPIQIILPRDPLALDDATSVLHEPKENERPRRTCRSQKSYAPPKRGRGGRGRGKRKLDNAEIPLHKKAKIDQDLTDIEKSTMSIITIDKSPKKVENLKENLCEMPMSSLKLIEGVTENLTDDLAKISILNSNKVLVSSSDNEKSIIVSDHQNWLAPTSRKVSDPSNRNETISTVQVIDEETRMSAESGSRSQTPARNIITVSETVINEESQGSVLSTATTESERVKVKNRRMEINFDPDEGSFTVDKIAEYEWPVDRKGETFMVQEQISQYLGVKSFKRKYPDLKRRIVDMEERNYLRENGLVSEAMCDMGLTSLYSSEVLDIMCSDFPDQYEEYRKHMREKQVKEHSKKQKELTAAANAERNRIDLAEMAMQSALSWNVNLNKARMDNRKSSLDLQTFTIHLPKKLQKGEADGSLNYYPVALIPGQYTDYYREYTPAELRYYPLNTVLYGPMKPNEHKFDSQSEGSQSDSDSDSSSDDSSSSSSDGTQGTEASQSTMDDVDMELVIQKSDGKSVKLIS